MADPIHEFAWHDDGHSIYVRIEGDKIRVTPAPCPHEESKDAECYHVGISGCAVVYFVQMYGLDCNVGVADPSPEMEISWAEHNIESYSIDNTQVWIMLNADEKFKSFLEALSEGENNG